MGEKSFYEKALDLDHRIIATIVPVIIVVFILNPVKIPFPVSKYTRMYYDFIQSIPDGSVVGFMMGDTPSTKPQLKSATVLTIVELWKKDCKIVFWYDQALSAPLLEEYIKDAIELLKKETGKEPEYGIDYVNLGYVAGEETGAAAFLKDIRAVTGGKDAYGNDLDDLPIMKNVNSGYDLKYGFANCACYCTEPMYVRQWQMPYGAQIATINCAMDLPAITLYLATGQLKGTANGLLGSAEMEYLTGHLGLAYGQTLAVSFAGLYFTILIVLGNVFFFAAKAKRR